ncbi:hypothetical protein GQ600_24426 [Phytophthora cactorum]|nr:hypothetical protein GQ600_24426 [Phytophthora cactorum]
MARTLHRRSSQISGRCTLRRSFCTHGVNHRYRGKGKRPRQEVRPMGCTGQINACIQVVSDSPVKFAVCVTKTALTHNHNVGLRSHKHYLSSRLTVNDKVLDTIDSLRKPGAKTKNIFKFIVENSDSNPNPQDVQTLVQNLKNREQGVTTRSQHVKKGLS